MAGVEGRVALVTGAGSPTGIGFACARQLTLAGAHVAITSTTDRIAERLAELPSGGDRAAWVTDLTDPNGANELVRSVVKRFGRLDILVNNAGMAQIGVARKWSRVQEISDEEWSWTLRQCLDTCFYVTRATIPHMRSQRYGRIVNVASVSGPIVTFDRAAGYGTAKAGMTGLTRSLAFELGRDGIIANVVAPGWIDNGKVSQQLLLGGQQTPVGRPGMPAEVGAAILFLASEEAGYITGQVIVVDGGNTIQEYKGPERPVDE